MARPVYLRLKRIDHLGDELRFFLDRWLKTGDDCDLKNVECYSRALWAVALRFSKADVQKAIELRKDGSR